MSFIPKHLMLRYSTVGIQQSIVARQLPVQSVLVKSHHRSFAAEPMKGKTAKIGSRTKQADEKSAIALAPFKPSEGGRTLPPPIPHGDCHDPIYRRRRGGVLLRRINADLTSRYDTDNRSSLFNPLSPSTYLAPGSVLLLETIQSRTKPNKTIFSGVLMDSRRKGVGSSFSIRQIVVDSVVEMRLPLYSPLLTRIKVLKRVGKDAWKGMTPKQVLEKVVADSSSSLREVDEVVMREREFAKKMAAAA
ncbi:hypothetical protein SmJEL517_g01174 [Synchytrium microbalum]|uniref:Ribosomal protein L19 n=1 Tax=Synchytrium microbalum TaxID=1806994 RepID=A0A507CAW6_9FUNG|nr:uncharacterized protein SmJEL517_g01174 [Synchytrium microbalum]TPX36601.1 hypothetical protein SmJEL517_g01174 [Synchytrium microbalum]